MKNNQPVTQQNYTFPEDTTLVSVTDLKGRITYCNDAFVQVSGFTRSELMGQPHNIVRHPDMPSEAFRDMWDTIQSGQPWSGIVKNRRKNGDHYWVLANATPMRDGERITGYLSVRSRASDEAIRQAKALYAHMNEEAKDGRRTVSLREGHVHRHDLLGRLHQLGHLDLLGKILLIQAVVALADFSFELMHLPEWVAALSILGAAAAGAYYLWRATVKPLHALIAESNRLASGDLSRPVIADQDGLIGKLQQALQQMSVNLRTVVSDVRQEVDRLNHAVAEIAQGNMDMSARTESQAASLEETAASMEEVNGTAQISADNAAQGAQLAADTASLARESNAAVSAAHASMEDIAAASRHIEDIVALIEDVSFQTNILSLNAAIEAARAGDAGRGFSIVAKEVRELSQRTAGAAKDIRALITNTAQRVQAGSRQTNHALERMQAALAAVEQVGHSLAHISHAAEEQRLGISQINLAVTTLDDTTQQNAAMVEQLAAAASSLQEQAESLSGSMRLFRLRQGDRTMSEVDAVEMRRANKDGANAQQRLMHA